MLPEHFERQLVSISLVFTLVSLGPLARDQHATTILYFKAPSLSL